MADQTNSGGDRVVIPPTDKPHEIVVKHNKSSFKDYLFEFLMLFLAVTLGFFVENTRENISDRKKARQYVSSLVQDLKDDTTKINYEMNRNWWLLVGVDSLIDALYEYGKGGGGGVGQPVDSSFIFNRYFYNEGDQVKKLYRLYVTYARTPYVVHFTDRTMTQLKNSGSMRLLPQDVSDSILKYESMVKYALANDKSYLETWTKLLDQSCEIFDYRYIRYNSYTNSYSWEGDELMNSSPEVLYKYAAKLELWRQQVANYRQLIYYTKLNAATLLPFLENRL